MAQSRPKPNPTPSQSPPTSDRRLCRLAQLVAVLLLACLSACGPRRATSAVFHALDARSGWNRTMPLVFEPQYADSTATYDLMLALRHTNAYRYANLSLVVDVMPAGSTKPAQRRAIDIKLADTGGNWIGAGFGSLYQTKVMLARGVTPQQAERVVVWQAMADVPTVDQLTEVGIIAAPMQ